MARGICDPVQAPGLVSQCKCELLYVRHPLGMLPTQPVLAIDVLQGLMIYDKNELPLYKIVMPMLQELNYGIGLQIIGGVILL